MSSERISKRGVEKFILGKGQLDDGISGLEVGRRAEEGKSQGLFDLKDIIKHPERYWAPKGKLLWDPVCPRTYSLYDVFYLQCDRNLPYDERHFASVEMGHARTRDFKHFQELPPALKPGKPGEWDSMAIWDGTVVRTPDRYYMLYTGISSRDRYQQIGLATSKDAIHWEKHPDNPVLSPHPLLVSVTRSLNGLGNPPAFRDPYARYDENIGKYFAVIAAREPDDRLFNGCVTLATSPDMVRWKQHEPIFTPGTFDEIEEPKMVQKDGRYYLFFSSYAQTFSEEMVDRIGRVDGLHCYHADKLQGPYEPANGTGLVYDSQGIIYGTKVLSTPSGQHIGVGWLDRTPDGKVLARMARPFKVNIEGDRVWTEPLKQGIQELMKPKNS